jgi:hypothetical protein
LPSRSRSAIVTAMHAERLTILQTGTGLLALCLLLPR